MQVIEPVTHCSFHSNCRQIRPLQRTLSHGQIRDPRTLRAQIWWQCAKNKSANTLWKSPKPWRSAAQPILISGSGTGVRSRLRNPPQIHRLNLVFPGEWPNTSDKFDNVASGVSAGGSRGWTDHGAEVFVFENETMRMIIPIIVGLISIRIKGMISRLEGGMRNPYASKKLLFLSCVPNRRWFCEKEIMQIRPVKGSSEF